MFHHHEFRHLLHVCKSNAGVFERLGEVMDHIIEEFGDNAEGIFMAGVGIVDAVKLAKYSHDKYLPAAKAYREYIHSGKCTGSNDPQFLKLKDALGGVSKQMYKRQRATFNAVVHVLTSASPVPPPDGLMDWAWHEVNHAERNALAQSRHQ